MKSLLIILIFLTTSSFAIFIWGYSLSPIYEVTVKETINAPIEVWGIMTDWEHQTEWRKEISKVEMKEGSKFIEYPKKGPPIEFEIIYLEKPKYFELFSMAGAVKGNYTAKLSFHNGITSIIAKEKVINSSIFSRIISSVFFDLEKFAKNYLSQLKEYAERT